MTKLSQSIRLLCFGLLLFCLPALRAQGTVPFQISTNPSGARFAVDGIIYTSAASFQWPAGSKHLVQFVQDLLPTSAAAGGDPGTPTLAVVQLSPDGGTVYSFTSWADSAGLLQPSSDPSQVVTADPSITSLVATVAVNYRLLLNFFDTPPATLPATCGAPGVLPPDQFRVGLIYIGGQCYWNNAILYFPAGQKLTLNAFPFPGFVFLGWSSNITPTAYLATFTLNGPITLAPRFGPAKRVRFETAPLGLQVLVDRTPTPTLDATDPNAPCPHNEGLPVTVASSFQALCRGDFDFAPGSTHKVGAVSPQIDLQGKSWVFSSWGDGHGQDDVYTTDYQTSIPDTVMVNFVPGAGVSFLTSPTGLQLSVDGNTSKSTVYNFVWGLGTTHQVTAPAQQTDASGRKFTFRAWSNGGGATQNITMDQAAVDSGFRLIASYDGLARLVVQTSPPGIKVQIDGTDCPTPCNVDRAAGSSVRVTVPTSISQADGVRQDLASLSDGGSADHTYTITADLQTLTASYTTSYRLSTGSDPANGCAFQLSPASPDGFYPDGSQVTVTATANDGFKFRRWGGDLSGTLPVGTLTMSGKRSVLALLDKIPYIAPAGVTNAAGVTPSTFVAPGSLIAIQGQSLAPDTLQGRVNPLAQTLDGVTVTVQDQLLPLVSVSPQTVIAQLPSTLALGDYTLQVHSLGQPDVNGTFTAARNAPGLFSNPANGVNYALANHADGTMVTADSPAVVGETITVFGTGFGPYASTVVDGFFPPNPPPLVADPVDVLVTGQVQTPTTTMAAAGMTGMVAVSLPITAAMPSGTNAELKVRVNGIESNVVLLPLQ